jgi:hypothetical protein
MNTPLTDVELLDLLADALDPAPIRPTPAEHEQLRQALATAPPPEAERQRTPRKETSLRRLPHPVAAAVIVATLTTGGTAAAVETNTLPGPLRSIAFAVGLPVTSPADQEVDNDLAALRGALNLGDATAIRADAAALSRDVDGLSPDDRVTVDGETNLLLAQADVWLTAHPSVSDQIASGGRHQGTDDRVNSGDRRAVTDRGSEGGPTDGRGDDGSGSQEPPSITSNTSNASNAQSGGNDFSSGTPGDGRQDGDGDSPSGTTPATGQSSGPADGGGGSQGRERGGGDSSGSEGGSSSSDGGASSSSGGPGSPPARSSSTGPAAPAQSSGGGGGGGEDGGGSGGGGGS